VRFNIGGKQAKEMLVNERRRGGVFKTRTGGAVNEGKGESLRETSQPMGKKGGGGVGGGGTPLEIEGKKSK